MYFLATYQLMSLTVMNFTLGVLFNSLDIRNLDDMLEEEQEE
jgi:hypothetical protein